MRRYTELLAALALSTGMALHAQTNEMVIQTKKLGAEIQPTMYGLFFEDINYAADGGLYAELVKNRSFEFPQRLMGWKTYGKVTLQDDGPFERNPHYVRLDNPGHAHKHTGLDNEGFFGIGMCAPTTSQYAAVEALRNGDEDVQHMRESYDQRRRFLINAFEEMHLDCFEPQGAFYMFPSIKRFGMTSEEFATRLLREEKVAVVPGTAFGDCGEGFLRVSYAYSLKSLKEALSRIKRFVDRLDGKTE